MNDLAVKGDKRMTVREVAEALGCDGETVRRHLKSIRANLRNVAEVENGKTTYMDEAEVTEIKRRIERSGRSDLGSVKTASETRTDLEMMAQAADVMRWLYAKVEEERAGRLEAERRNAVLMHVSKTYTATEVAKEMGLRSAQELNKFLAGQGIQYYINGSWVPYAAFADQGYFELKQEILDNGHVVYHRRITQDGRAFILSLIGR